LRIHGEQEIACENQLCTGHAGSPCSINANAGPNSGRNPPRAHEPVEADCHPERLDLGEVGPKRRRVLGDAVVVLGSDVGAKARADIIDKFQRDTDPRVLVLQPQAASHGITLTAADTLVFWSPVLSVETFLQCIGRVDRVGQVNKVLVVMLQGSDIERKTYAALRGKIDGHIQLTELYKQVME